MAKVAKYKRNDQSRGKKGESPESVLLSGWEFAPVMHTPLKLLWERAIQQWCWNTFSWPINNASTYAIVHSWGDLVLA